MITATVIGAVMHFYNLGENTITRASEKGFGLEELERAPLTMYNTKQVKGTAILQCLRQYSSKYEIHIQTIAMQNATDANTTKDYYVYGDFNSVEKSQDPEHKKVPTRIVTLMNTSGTEVDDDGDGIADNYDVKIKADLNGDGVIQEHPYRCYVDQDPTKGLVAMTDEHAALDYPGVPLEVAKAQGHVKVTNGSEVSTVNPYWVNPDGDFLATVTKENGAYVISFRQELN